MFLSSVLIVLSLFFYSISVFSSFFFPLFLFLLMLLLIFLINFALFSMFFFFWFSSSVLYGFVFCSCFFLLLEIFFSYNFFLVLGLVILLCFFFFLPLLWEYLDFSMIPVSLVNILFINVNIEFLCSIKSTFFITSLPDHFTQKSSSSKN